MPTRLVQSEGQGLVGLSQGFAAGSHNITRPYRTYYLDVSGGAITMIADPSPVLNDEYLFKVNQGDAGVNAVSFNSNGIPFEGVVGIASLINFGRGWARVKYDGSGWSLV